MRSSTRKRTNRPQEARCLSRRRVGCSSSDHRRISGGLGNAAEDERAVVAVLEANFEWVVETTWSLTRTNEDWSHRNDGFADGPDEKTRANSKTEM